MYQSEDKEVREQYEIQYWNQSGSVPFIDTKYIWAYTQAEAEQSLIDDGYKLPTISELLRQ